MSDIIKLIRALSSCLAVFFLIGILIYVSFVFYNVSSTIQTISEPDSECEDCEGTGTIVCTACNGEGVTKKINLVPEVNVDEHGNFTKPRKRDPEYETCFRCDGSEEMKCPKCLLR